MTPVIGKDDADKAPSTDDVPGHISSSDEKMIDNIPHQSVGFWHHRLSKVRKHVIQLWIRTGKLTSRKWLL